MIPMKCLKAVTYDGRRYRPGDTFTARGEGDARTLAAVKLAERVAAPSTPVMYQYGTKVVVAEKAPAKPKRQYRRRDLTAEE